MYEIEMGRKSHSKTADISAWLCSLLLKKKKAIYFEHEVLWVQVKSTIKEVTHKVLKLPVVSSVSNWRPPPWTVSRMTVSDSKISKEQTFIYIQVLSGMELIFFQVAGTMLLWA